MKTHVYLDVDGVLNAVTFSSAPAWGWPEPAQKISVAGFEINYSPSLVERLNALAALEAVEFFWLTTWQTDAPTCLAGRIGLNGAEWPVVGREHHHDPRLRNQWWKLAAIRDHLAATSPTKAVWIDDDISFDRQAVQWLATQPHVTGWSPQSQLGITQSQMSDIERADDVVSTDDELFDMAPLTPAAPRGSVYPTDVLVAAQAVFSRYENYRYFLGRDWLRPAQEPRLAHFVMLNPSTADASEDDPTIRRCVSFARALGCNGLDVTNLYAWRATKPTVLWSVGDPIGPENDTYLAKVAALAAVRREPLIAAWGANAQAARVEAVMAIPGFERATALGVTKDGSPRHPLYLPSSAPPGAVAPAGGRLMPRLMSVALTEEAVLARQKTVTRRLGWCFAKVGDRVTLCRKVMGRKPDEPLVRLVDVVLVAVSREPLNAITDEDVELEGFRDTTAAEFVEFFTTEMKCAPDTVVTRLEWRYVE